MVKWLVIINCAIYVLMLLASGLNLFKPEDVYLLLGIVPTLVVHGWVWQVATYSFIHGGFWHLFGNMLALWMFGAQFETDWGRKQFLEFYFFCVVGAALTSIIVGYGALAAYHSWQVPLIGTIS
jgi:membrane associated rhomboid family serine protease